MLTITDAARQKLIELRESKGQHGLALRLSIVGRGNEDFRYQLRFVDPASQQEGDIAFDPGDLPMLIDAASAANLQGTVIDFSGLGQGGLRIDNPNPVWPDATARRIAEVIERHINPGVRSHGGNVTLVDYRDGVASISMSGGCQGCGMAAVTLKMGVERMICEAVPEVREVVDITEHAAGSNPFYRTPADGQSSPLAGQG